jgi:hypothetical protein
MSNNPGGGQEMIQKSPIRKRDDSGSDSRRVEAQPTYSDSDSDEGVIADANSSGDEEPDIS